MAEIFGDRDLRRWYNQFNELYFKGVLPDDVDVVYAPHEGCTGTASQDEAGFVILINPQYSVNTRDAKIVLLHEMTHMLVWPYRWHGEKFQNVMLNLAMQGAFKGLW